MKHWQIILLALGLLVGVQSVHAQQQTLEYTGYMSDDVPDDRYPVTLAAGDTIVVSAEATSGDLDTYIFLEDAEGNIIAENDDRGDGTLNSQYTYTASADATYRVIISNYQGSGGNYRVQIEVFAQGTAPQPTPTSPPSPAPAEEIPFTDDAAVHTGFMGDSVSDDRYSVTVQSGQLIRAVMVAAPGSELDTYLVLEDASGEIARENDDRGDGTFNSEILFPVETGGNYTVVASNFPDTSGDYILTIDVLDPEEAAVLLANVADLDRGILLSGAPQRRETENFVIHYTLEGEDAATEAYIDVVAQTVEEVWQIQIVDAGWSIPPNDGDLGGDSRIDIFITDLIKADGEGSLGTASPGAEYGDNPNTTSVEIDATDSYLTVDNDLDQQDGNVNSAYSVLRATIAHEFHHAIQYGYSAQNEHNWYYEATATWMETFTFPLEEDATGYVDDNFTYPEICFGADGDADPTGGLLKYGDWMFIQSLVDVHGQQVVNQLWENMVGGQNFAPLEDTLSANGEDIPTAVARYRLQNLVRDYALTSRFGATVWLENTITDVGTWTYSGQGIQELAANYFEVDMQPGTYSVTFSTANPNLQLWGVGIRGQAADAVLLGSSGTFDTSGYDHYYLMVFNTRYDNDIQSCIYDDYSLDIKAGQGSAPTAVYVWDASQFEPLVMQN